MQSDRYVIALVAAYVTRLDQWEKLFIVFRFPSSADQVGRPICKSLL